MTLYHCRAQSWGNRGSIWKGKGDFQDAVRKVGWGWWGARPMGPVGLKGLWLPPGGMESPREAEQRWLQ